MGMRAYPATCDPGPAGSGASSNRGFSDHQSREEILASSQCRHRRSRCPRASFDPHSPNRSDSGSRFRPAGYRSGSYAHPGAGRRTFEAGERPSSGWEGPGPWPAPLQTPPSQRPWPGSESSSWQRVLTYPPRGAAGELPRAHERTRSRSSPSLALPTGRRGQPPTHPPPWPCTLRAGGCKMQLRHQHVPPLRQVAAGGRTRR